MLKKKTILIAPLHWGLGHATRCIPIIRALLDYGFEVLLASDGAALLLLQKEFPELKSLELPSYNITYPKKGIYFKWKILLKLPHIRRTISAEKRILKQLVAEGKIHGIISDNRFGVRNSKIPSVFITHQLNVLTGSTSYFSSKMHQKIIKKFDACWVPDVDDLLMNLSGKLGHLTGEPFPIKYIGVLSRMEKKEVPITIDILVLLSGPEPQRTIFEEKLKETLKKSEKKILMIRGIIEKEQKWQDFENIKMVNFMTSEELEDTLNKSEVIISRSGYTTIMDLTVLEKKAFFIPTPGQYEQIYLAERLKDLGIVPSCKQEKFKLKKLDKVAVYKGLKTLSQQPVNFSKLFSLFEGE
ncbi:glycosyltransferase [Aequorivita antarctica]|uniref:UDP-N-acetylglucosamine--N-acetylmuramyl-(Pentapeptide) pyrophosphoryl-undecaprenol N-acetylglucosamine transferase n=1 Tax=Aequorivita antarctica TaxID=153266 RepID=A0A5C6Z1N4_9FLAO|nr:glycosyltransferase [Aequorivita antarctica]TXD73948.1 UDP-N-acetylglucosamine--N-acetylmuramyl-(pentapeptide) pyrophosphoryl-undecaprenol N-acetylglucosamine transferase [Aequorivita antarctica]SRX73332.1 UDP-N-acetylglucosamine--N-acetylmuramyl-(pentapeptide) pyrophosphoryl-undecaprenol N-acetylglucosamine transferase [Aequorivita antarctica]